MSKPPSTDREVFAEIYFLEPGPGRDDMSEGINGHLFPSWPEADLWVIEQTNMHRNWLVTGTQLTSVGPEPDASRHEPEAGQ